MAEMIRIAVDVMGGDNAPAEHVKGCVEAVKENPQISLILVGDQEAVSAELAKYSDYPADRISIRHASEVIGTAEPPVQAIQKKKDSSMVVGLTMVKAGEAQAFVSSGNTGALLVGGIGIVGRIKGVERATVGTVMPTVKGISILLDAGANVDCRASHLVQFARMGSIYMQYVLGVSNPTVGIVNNGAEEDKGNSLVKETFPLLAAQEDLNFIGSVEARDIPFGAADVLVCDGFVGNAILKMYEGTADALVKVIKEKLKSSFISMIGGLMIKSSLKGVLKTYDPTQYGGAPFLGLKGLVVKMHGSAKAKEVRIAISQCAEFSAQDIPAKIAERLAVKKE